MKKNGLLHIYHFLLWLGFFSMASAAFGAELDRYVVPDSAYHLREALSDRPLTTEQALASPEWKKSAHLEQENFGFSRDSYWIKFELRNPYPGRNALILEIANHELNHILFTLADVQKEGRKEEFRSLFGARHAFAQRPMSASKYAIPITILPGEVKQVLFRVSTQEGLYVPIHLWYPDEFAEKEQKYLQSTLLFLGAIAAMCIYNAMIFFMTRNESYLFYSGFVFFVILLTLHFSGFLAQYIITDSPYLLRTFGQLGLSGSSIFSALFCRSFLELPKFAPKIDRWFKVMIALKSCGLFSGVIGFYGLAVALTVPAAGAISGLCLLAGLVLFNKSRQAKFYLVSLSALGVCVVFFTLGRIGVLSSGIFTTKSLQLGMFAECMLLSLAMGDKINQLRSALYKSNQNLSTLNENLETMVSEKTKSIRSILDSIPQGVLAIEQHLQVHPDVSAHLKRILDQEDFAHKSFHEVFLSHLTLGEDEVDRITQTLAASIGEDILNFELNRENLPREVEFKRYRGQSKILAVTWDPVLREDQHVQHILVTLLDQTQSKAIELELLAKQKDLRLLKELIDCGDRKFSQFALTVQPLIEENLRLVQNIQDATDDSTIKILFINAHTAKGGARTLGLSLLANALHEAEQYYSDLVKAKELFEKKRLEADILKIKSVFETYLKVNQVDLGRVLDANVIAVRRNFLSGQFDMLNRLEKMRVEDRDVTMAADLRRSIDEISAMIFSELSFVIEDCFAQTGKIAKDLGKAQPQLVVKADEYKVPQFVGDVLQKIFVHLARNIMDHGIELPEERLVKGKTVHGLIVIEARVVANGLLTIVIQDDGRGLPIAKLRERAMKDNLVSAAATAEQLAEMVFYPGLSTAKNVSHISGRGVGMDAVRRYLEAAGGSIHLELSKSLDASGDFYDFRTIIEIPLLAENKSTFDCA